MIGSVTRGAGLRLASGGCEADSSNVGQLTTIYVNAARRIEQPRHADYEPAINALRNRIASGDKRLSDDGRFSIADLGLAPGLACFTVRDHGQPITICSGCWDEAFSAKSWDAAEKRFLLVTELEVRLDAGWSFRDKPPPVPWLAWVALPGVIALEEEDRKALEVMQALMGYVLIDLDGTARKLSGQG